jgi:ATP-dependent RNA helicase MSS116
MEDYEDNKQRFADLEDLNPITKQNLAANNLEYMTEIQAKTWEACVKGKDVLGRSRTGSGKTVAFLLPAIERVLREPKEGIRVLIISPTRELAAQIDKSAAMLVARHRGLSHNVFYGGVSKQRDIRDLERNLPSILTCTPGRLQDHLDSSYVGRTPFRDLMNTVDVLILDEMDRLLDMGFRDAIQNILQYIPRERQTLLFSATVPKEVKQMINFCIKPDFIHVDCINDEDPSTQTVNTVEQTHLILPKDKLVTGVVQTVLHVMKTNENHKILVFFPTTSQVAYYSDVFNKGLGYRVLEIHSKKDQNVRSRTSEQFRQAARSVMFTSDVSARGVDYPDVSHVIQVGVARDRETYIHRLGRTARAGKSGQGLLILMEEEKSFLEYDLAGVSIPRNTHLKDIIAEEQAHLAEDMQRFRRACADGILSKRAEDAYRALFGYYIDNFKRLGIRGHHDVLVDFINNFASQAGLRERPGISLKLAQQYGLDNHPELRIQSSWDSGSRNFDTGRSGGFRAGSRGGGGFSRGGYGGGGGGYNRGGGR